MKTTRFFYHNLLSSP